MDSEAARAKVNLYLHVVGRRADGYHLLDSLAVFPPVADHLRAEAAGDLTLEIVGPFGHALVGDNLVLRAAEALRRAASLTIGARLVLEKNLPVASGIGGGSADAAAALRLLGRVWRTDIPAEALTELALALGADVPVCLHAQPARMGGTGERLSPAPAMPDAGIVLVNPGAPVSTADVFRARAANFSDPGTLPPRWADARVMAEQLRGLKNDLEPAARRLCPPIDDVLAWLERATGCLLARMSGSGATCFGLFTTPESARLAAATARREWWAWGGALT